MENENKLYKDIAWRNLCKVLYNLFFSDKTNKAVPVRYRTKIKFFLNNKKIRIGVWYYEKQR